MKWENVVHAFYILSREQSVAAYVWRRPTVLEVLRNAVCQCIFVFNSC